MEHARADLGTPDAQMNKAQFPHSRTLLSAKISIQILTSLHVNLRVIYLMYVVLLFKMSS